MNRIKISVPMGRPKFNKPITDTPLEFGLYIILLEDRRSNRHFKMMRRFT